jgi:type II secretory ATPase GspE/PulE/Tfp pilus assembly ATPase PilB-like protein
MTLLEALAKKRLIAEKEIPAIQKEIDTSGKTLETILAQHGISAEDILKIKGEVLEVPTRSIGNEDVPFSVLEYIPEESAIHYKFVPLGVKDGMLEVGLIEPDNIEARDALNFISSKINLPYKIFLISQEDFDKVLSIYKGLSAEVTQALSELETELKTPGQEEEREVEKVDAGKGKVETKIVEDAPVTKIVATILRYATEGNASDIHIEHLA